MNLDLKKIYYYIIALVTFIILIWGFIDFASSLSTYLVDRSLGVVPDKTAMQTEDYYQGKAVLDRTVDGLTRAIIAGLVFGYAKMKLKKMEEV